MMTRDDAAAHIREKHNQKCTAGYLTKLASIGGGPPFYRVGGRVEYDPVDLDTWAQSRISGPLRKSSDARRAA
jgi:hypothetical protein